MKMLDNSIQDMGAFTVVPIVFLQPATPCESMQWASLMLLLAEGNIWNYSASGWRVLFVCRGQSSNHITNLYPQLI